MTKLILLVLLTLGLAAPAAASAPGIAGRWVYYKKVYRDTEFPEDPAPDLRMEFSFTGSGNSELSWRHEVEADHCRRRGVYRTEGGELVEEVVWVDPENSSTCARDPDMQLGRRTRTPYLFYGPDLAIRFFLGDEPLDLVWKKMEDL